MVPNFLVLNVSGLKIALAILVLSWLIMTKPGRSDGPPRDIYSRAKKSLLQFDKSNSRSNRVLPS
jgi:hypothetical protein